MQRSITNYSTMPFLWSADAVNDLSKCDSG